MQLSTVASARLSGGARAPSTTKGAARPSLRAGSAVRPLAVPMAPAGAAAVALPLPSEEQVLSEAAQAALAYMAPHPSALQPGNLVPALQAALSSLSQRPSRRSWERAVLASPLLLGLLTLSTDLLSQPAAAGLGPEAPLLVLEVLSYMQDREVDESCPSSSHQAQQCAALWRRAHFALGEAADLAGVWSVLNGDLVTPDMTVRYYEAAARSPCAGAPCKSRGMGLLLRAHLKDRSFTTSESVRLLTAWAELRQRMPFNPDSYNFAELAAHLEGRACQLSADQLVAVAQAAPTFEWPVYRSVPLLHAVSREAVHRSLAGSLPLPVAQQVLATSAKGAAAIRPRLGHDLEEATSEWMRSAPGLRNSSVPLPAACMLTAAQQQQQQGMWARGAAVAVAAECMQAAQSAWIDASTSLDIY